MKIIATVLKSILRKVHRIRRATNFSIDDILVDKTVVSATEVVNHLKKFGLFVKSLEPRVGGAALGFKLQSNKTGSLYFGGGMKSRN